MAFDPSGRRFSSSIASAVGKINNSILRRWASAFTSSMTGKAPVPVPTTNRQHFHGMSSCSLRELMAQRVFSIACGYPARKSRESGQG